MKTPLYGEYAHLPGVKLTDFGGWTLPLHFSSGIISEHHDVRQKAGLFDVSHMGRFMISGPKATEYLDLLVTNSVASMEDGQLIYTFICYPDGTIVDDIILYRISGEQYWLVVNAANREKDFAWITKENPYAKTEKGETEVVDFTPFTSQLALQGPLALSVLEKLAPEVATLKFFHFLDDVNIGGVKALVSRNGYTGEDGFELYCENEAAQTLWRKLASDSNVTLCGLGSRDTLRLEAKLPLYGHEIGGDITPLEANLGVFVKFDKPDFCGKEALLKEKEEGIKRSVRGIEMVDRAVPRHGYRVFFNNKDIGYVTSGTKSPTLGIFCGYVIIERSTSLSFGETLFVEIHGKMREAKIVKTPFYKRGE